MSSEQVLSLFKESVCPAFNVGNTTAPTDSLASWKSYWKPLAASSAHSAKLLLHPFAAFPSQVSSFLQQTGAAIQEQADYQTKLATVSSLTEGASLAASYSSYTYSPTSITPGGAAQNWFQNNGASDLGCS